MDEPLNEQGKEKKNEREREKAKTESKEIYGRKEK